MLLNFLNRDHEWAAWENDYFSITVGIQEDLLIRLVKSPSNSDFMIKNIFFALLIHVFPRGVC